MKKTSDHAVRVVSVLLTAAVALGMLFAGCSDNGSGKPGGVNVKPASVPATAADYAELYEKVNGLVNGGCYDDYAYNGMADGLVYETNEMIEEAPMAPEPEATTTIPASNNFSYSEEKAEIASDESYSGTNVQVDGVDEADILKTDGNYIYLLRSGRLTIADAKSMTELSTVEADAVKYASPYEMYLSGDRLALIVGYDMWYKLYMINGGKGDWDYDEYQQGSKTGIIFYDISDRSAPKELNTLTQDGSYVSSRMTGGSIFCVSSEYLYGRVFDEKRPETFVPCVSTESGGIAASEALAPGDICLFDDCSEACYTVLTSCSVDDCSTHSSAKAAFGRAGTIYSDGEVMLIASDNYTSGRTEGQVDGKNAVTTVGSSRTDLMLYSIGGGDLTLTGKGTIPGSLVNQFAIDRYNGYFRFVTTVDSYTEIIYTDGIDTYEHDSDRFCALYTTDSGLNMTGSIEDLAEDEQVYSVRFYGDIAYFVTFRRTDPLFCADLSDPAAPKILGALKIPGFSEYLQKYSDTLLFGLGRDADERTGIAGDVKLSMFDISDPANVFERDKLSTDNWYSEALYNHKAILVSPERNLIAFSLDNSSYVVYSYEEGTGFTEKCRIDEEDTWHSFYRGLFIGDHFYIVNEAGIRRYDMNNGFAPDGTLTFTPLPEENYLYIEETIDE